MPTIAAPRLTARPSVLKPMRVTRELSLRRVRVLPLDRGTIMKVLQRSAWLVVTVAVLAGFSGPAGSKFPDPVQDIKVATPGTEQTAVLAGGCFWGVEAVFERLQGVSDVVSGFAGGSKATAHYEVVSSGTTGHAESVKITYDPGKISYGQLLKIFFAVAHDPTELNRQGPDEGTQYRSSI